MSSQAGKTLQAIKFDREQVTLQILDQLLLPYNSQYIDVSTISTGYDVIKSMQVRGAPAIAIVGCFSIIVELHTAIVAKQNDFQYTLNDFAVFKTQLVARIHYLISSRPTAVNLSNACNEIIALVESHSNSSSAAALYAAIYSYGVQLYDDDLANNFRIGANGVAYMNQILGGENATPYSIMTVCNTGALATSGHGTALGIIRSAWRSPSSDLKHVFPLETRPYNQGARLTAYELVYENIAATLITDSMASYLIHTLKQQQDAAKPPIRFIIVGADRIVRNGDTANKIGTFQLATIAEHNPDIRFIVAAPKTTIDLKMASGAEIVIEQRPGAELTQVTGGVIDPVTSSVRVLETGAEIGKVGVGAPGISVWNPAFDVTPYQLIDAIVTEDKVVVKGPDGKFDLVGLF
ncbi:hypothetical protein BABINDRAFT_33494 [Babjeviella inositovora NRRL Y-12698]|uniref:Methylthioribose-1-phosphate isomerase n=1 Tax=Babjeviella inositovora NRRL Y-12698 TaxID=984486 RepID=A0A1E3QUH6_9ASCO|nr:uncharacterized protein BABINDRAFT_33494 [Babjeviella inositovora NRRL Y-12698]ODQ81341.1 hypothetical protein BABINDRAFT_33494 [Babjeviella inositovora NRRL Y-12698]